MPTKKTAICPVCEGRCNTCAQYYRRNGRDRPWDDTPIDDDLGMAA